MKAQPENQGNFQKILKAIRGYTKAINDRIRKHTLYHSIESTIGKKRMPWLMIGGCLLLSLLILTHCTTSGNKHKKTDKLPVSVITTAIRQADVPVYLKAIGTVTPLESVTVRTQINGRLSSIHFKEGQMVTKGQVLARVDTLPYEALLKQYEGQLMRDQALLLNARIDLKRYEKLYSKDSIAQQTLETQKHLVEQYEGMVLSDQGLVDGAKVNLHHCLITSNFSGMIGLRQIDPGNFVQTTDTTPITTINMISPITVVFPIPENDLGQVLEKFWNQTPLAADALDRKEDKILATGHLLAIDSQINATTGTINLKASFTNEDHRLFPNQFVNVRLKVDTLRNVLIVPTVAIQMGQKGSFVYVVNADKKTVSAKSVTVETSEGGQSCLSGDVAEGQAVVIQGTDKLSEGAPVTLSPASSPKPGKPALP